MLYDKGEGVARPQGRARLEPDHGGVQRVTRRRWITLRLVRLDNGMWPRGWVTCSGSCWDAGRRLGPSNLWSKTPVASPRSHVEGCAPARSLVHSWHGCLTSHSSPGLKPHTDKRSTPSAGHTTYMYIGYEHCRASFVESWSYQAKDLWQLL